MGHCMARLKLLFFPIPKYVRTLLLHFLPLYKLNLICVHLTLSFLFLISHTFFLSLPSLSLLILQLALGTYHIPCPDHYGPNCDIPCHPTCAKCDTGFYGATEVHHFSSRNPFCSQFFFFSHFFHFYHSSLTFASFSSSCSHFFPSRHWRLSHLRT